MGRKGSGKPRESIWTGAPYGTTTKVGSPDTWRASFDDALKAMGIGEAKDIVGEDDPFTILGVAANATAEVIKAAFRRMILKHHPDKNPGDKEAAEAQTRRILAAYTILTQ
jgi:DnaJ-domain-containing protein 1